MIYKSAANIQNVLQTTRVFQQKICKDCTWKTRHGEVLGQAKRAEPGFSVSEEKTNAFVLFFSRLFVSLQSHYTQQWK